MICRVMRPLYSLKNERGDVICKRCVVADSIWSRLRGLLGRQELASDEGLLLTPESNVHAWRTVGHRGARSVLELQAGTSRRLGLRPGDRLALDDFSEDEANVML